MSILSLTSTAHKSVGSFVKNLIKPQNLGWISTKFPETFNCITTQKIINKTFSEQIADGDFDFLQGRLLQIEILDANLYVGLSFNNNRIICTQFSNIATQADATLSIDTPNAISLVQQEIDPDTLFFQRKLKIKGDTELAHHVKNTIDTLDPEVIPNIIMKLVSEYKQRVLTE